MAAAAAAAIALGLLAWLSIRHDDKTAPPPARKTTAVVSASRLESAASRLPFPVYWAGERPKVKYELTTISDGRAYVRYLPARGADPQSPYLTIGSYRKPAATDVLRGVARRSGQRLVTVPGKGVAVPIPSSSATTGWYVAYPSIDVQIEVFDPKPSRAGQLVRSGLLRTVSANAVR